MHTGGVKLTCRKIRQKEKGGLMRNRLQRLLDYGYEEIDRIAPFHEEVEVKVVEDGKNHFMARMKVKVNNKVYFVKKEGLDMYEGFHKALRAMKAKLAKNKVNHRVKRKMAYDIEIA